MGKSVEVKLGLAEQLLHIQLFSAVILLMLVVLKEALNQ